MAAAGPIFCLLGAALLWSTSGVLIKLVDWPPMPIAGVRSAVAAVVLAVAIGRPRLTWSRPQVAAALSYSVSVTLFVIAMKWTTAANAIVLQYTAPIYVAAFGGWFLAERASRLDWIAIAVTLAGIALFFLDELSATGFWGNVAALGSGMAFAGLILSLRALKHASPFESVLVGNLLVAAISVPFVPDRGPGWNGWLALLFLGVFQLGIAHLLYATALKRVRALEAAIVPMIEPILNPLWVLLIVGERPGPFAIIGGSLVLATIAARGAIARRSVRP